MTLGDIWHRLEIKERLYLISWINVHRSRKNKPRVDMATLPFVTIKEAADVGFTMLPYITKSFESNIEYDAWCADTLSGKFRI